MKKKELVQTKLMEHSRPITICHYYYYLPADSHIPLHPWRPQSIQHTLTEDLCGILGKHPLPPQSQALAMPSPGFLRHSLSTQRKLPVFSPPVTAAFSCQQHWDRGNEEKAKVGETVIKHIPCMCKHFYRHYHGQLSQPHPSPVHTSGQWTLSAARWFSRKILDNKLTSGRATVWPRASHTKVSTPPSSCSSC